MKACPICHQYRVIEPAGPERADILVVGEAPTHRDLKRGYPFAEEAGDLLQTECSRAGFSFAQTRRMYLWGHDPRIQDEKKKKAWSIYQELMPDEFLYWRGELIEAMRNRKGVVLSGPGVLSAFIGATDIQSMYGLEFTHPLVPHTAGVVMIVPSVQSVIATGIGEMRLALSKFYQRVKEGKQ